MTARIGDGVPLNEAQYQNIVKDLDEALGQHIRWEVDRTEANHLVFVGEFPCVPEGIFRKIVSKMYATARLVPVDIGDGPEVWQGEVCVKWLYTNGGYDDHRLGRYVTFHKN